MTAAGSPALRLLADDGRLVLSRPLVLARGAARRARGATAWAIWPDAEDPIQAVDVTAPDLARFMRSFAGEPETRRPLVDAARARLGPLAWELARAGALYEPAAPGLAERALAHVLGDAVGDARIALFSPSGSRLAKVACFALAKGASAPAAVVLAMADARWAPRLRAETELVEELRARLGDAPGVAAALPLAPLGTYAPADDYAVVLRPDPLAARTGDIVAPDRERAWAWLRELHAATAAPSAPYAAGEADAAVEAVAEAWALLGPAASARASDLARRALAPALDAPSPVCAVHGDFWRGNVSHDERTLRVFDWEWARLEGRPVFDLWTWELSEIQHSGALPPSAVRERLGAALERVEAELRARGAPAALAAASLAPSAAELVVRMRRATGVPGAAERDLLALLEPIEQVLQRCQT